MVAVGSGVAVVDGMGSGVAVADGVGNGVAVMDEVGFLGVEVLGFFVGFFLVSFNVTSTPSVSFSVLVFRPS